MGLGVLWGGLHRSMSRGNYILFDKFELSLGDGSGSFVIYVGWKALCKIFIYYIQPLGDPKQDLAYERQYEQQTYQVIPEVIKNFIQYFHKTVSDLIDQKVYELQASRVSSDVIDQKVYEIQDIYENRYGLLADGTVLNGAGRERERVV